MIQVNRLKQRKDESDMARWVTDKRLYLSEDGVTVVDEAAPGRKTLLAPAGSQITDAVCKRYGLGPYAEQPDPPEADEEETDPEAAGSCCSHAFRVHRKEDGLCGQRRHCGCQGWLAQQPGDGGSGGDQDVKSADTGEPGGDGSKAESPAV